MRFVIADDSRIHRNYLRGILQRAGHEIVGDCEDGILAVEATRDRKPDVVILDVLMPKMTGLEAAQIIVEQGLCRHVVIASSNSQRGIVNQLADIGCAFVAKPYEDVQLLRELDAITGPMFRVIDGGKKA